MLTGKQKRYLRGLGNTLNPIVMVGKEELSTTVIQQAEEALIARELVKGRVQPNCPQTVEDIASALSEALDAQLVQVIGRNFLLYRRSPEEPHIELP